MTATAAHTTTGGSTSAESKRQTEQLIRHAHVILSACGRTMSAAKVMRLVNRYQHQVERSGWVFWDFFANAMLLTKDQRSRMVSDPEVAQVISYLDPTGEDAVANVMRRRGR